MRIMSPRHCKNQEAYLPTRRQPISPMVAPVQTRMTPRTRPNMAPAARLSTEAGRGSTAPMHPQYSGLPNTKMTGSILSCLLPSKIEVHRARDLAHLCTVHIARQRSQSQPRGAPRSNQECRPHGLVYERPMLPQESAQQTAGRWPI